MKQALFFMLAWLLTGPACAKAGGSEDAIPTREAPRYVIEYQLQPEAPDAFACEVSQVSGRYECGYDFSELKSADHSLARQNLQWTRTVNIGYEEKPQILEKLVRNWNAMVSAVSLAVATESSSVNLKVFEYPDPPLDNVRCSREVSARGACTNIFYKYHAGARDPSKFYGDYFVEEFETPGAMKFVYRFSESHNRQVLSLVEGVLVANSSGEIELAECYIWKGHPDEIKAKLLNECVVLAAGLPVFLKQESGKPLRGGDPDFIDALLAGSPILNLDLSYICKIELDW